MPYAKPLFLSLRLQSTKSYAFVLIVAVLIVGYQSVTRLIATQGSATQGSGQNQDKTNAMTFERCPVFAIESVELPSQEPGVIATLSVVENDMVVANQVIAKLDAKVAELEKSVAGLQSQVATAEANDESEIRLAEAFRDEASLQVDIYEEMTSKGNSSDYDLRQKQLALAQTKVRITQAQASKQQKDLRAKLAQASVVLGQQKADRLTLKSPIAGTVVRIDHRPGEWVQAGTTIVKIIRLDELRVDCFVDINQIDPSSLVSQAVWVTAKRGNSETRFVGKITSFDPDISSLGSVRVHAVVQNQKDADQWRLLPGMTVQMQIDQVRKP